MTDLFLIFAMQLDSDRQLNRGRLILFDRVRGPVGRWVATSGLPQFQNVGDWNHPGGGVLPPTYQLKTQIPWYRVAIEPTDLRDLKGVEGNGYAITPFDVETSQGVERSDIMIHRDANVPGTLACIGLQGMPEWNDFECVWKRETAKLLPEVKTIDLSVIYTY
jgi:hypothetical protein